MHVPRRAAFKGGDTIAKDDNQWVPIMSDRIVSSALTWLSPIPRQLDGPGALVVGICCADIADKSAPYNTWLFLTECSQPQLKSLKGGMSWPRHPAKPIRIEEDLLGVVFYMQFAQGIMIGLK